MSSHTSVNRTALVGLSLIELMIAMAIGVVLLLGLVQVMAGSRAAYQLSAGVARTQENARFAIDSLQRDLRMAGHLGCVNDQARMQVGMEGVHLKFLTAPQQVAKEFSLAAVPLRFDMGLQGFDAKATAPGGSIVLPTTTAAAANANLWEPSLPGLVKALNPVAGSDVLLIRYFAPAGVGLADNGFLPTSSGTKATITPASAGTEVTSDLAKDGTALFGIADCTQATVFAGVLEDVASGRIGFASATAPNKSGYTGLEAYQPAQSTLYRAESLAYYVGVGAGGGPALFRARISGAGAYVPEELVEGVESLQLLYGRDHADTSKRPSGYVSRSSVAKAIGGGEMLPNNAQADDWRRVGMVQVGLLMRSSDRAAATQADNKPSVLDVQMAPASNDGYYRSVYETSVALRNRLFGD